jgi:hypothetical protein
MPLRSHCRRADRASGICSTRYFADENPVRWLKLRRAPVLGSLVVACGIVLSLPGVPGPGLLTILLGMTLLDGMYQPFEAEIRHPADGDLWRIYLPCSKQGHRPLPEVVGPRQAVSHDDGAAVVLTTAVLALHRLASGAAADDDRQRMVP